MFEAISAVLIGAYISFLIAYVSFIYNRITLLYSEHKELFTVIDEFVKIIPKRQVMSYRNELQEFQLLNEKIMSIRHICFKSIYEKYKGRMSEHSISIRNLMDNAASHILIEQEIQNYKQTIILASLSIPYRQMAFRIVMVLLIVLSAICCTYMITHNGVLQPILCALNVA